jgi:2'-5' RNA ligase
MRTFIAIDFSQQLKNEISNLQADVRSLASSGRWKFIDNFHLTLKFLDEINANMIESISRELYNISKETSRFKLNISGIGNFPGKGSIRVLWLGLGGETDRLNVLQNMIDASLKNLGFAVEKRSYTPHITIAQDVVFSREFSEIEKISKAKQFSEINVESIFLFKSEQIGHKRVYTSIGEFRFQ